MRTGDTVATDWPAAPGLGPLCAALSLAQPGRRLVVIDTRMSQVLLAGPWAIKLRRAWPAFARASARCALLERELRCNRQVSPAVYVGVFPIAGGELTAFASEPHPALPGLRRGRAQRLGFGVGLTAQHAVRRQGARRIGPQRGKCRCSARGSGMDLIHHRALLAVQRTCLPAGRPVCARARRYDIATNRGDFAQWP